MSWYRIGKASITKGDKTLTGYGTKWADNKHSINRGHIVLLPGSGTVQLYEIEDVKTDNQIILTTAYTGNSVNQGDYAIINTLTSTVPDFAVRLAAQLKYNQELFSAIEEWVDGKGNVTITLPNGNTIEMPSVSEINKNIEGKINKELIRIPGGTDLLTYFPGKDTGFYSSGGDVSNSPDNNNSWMNYRWTKHGGFYGVLEATVGSGPQANRVFTNSYNNKVWSGWSEKFSVKGGNSVLMDYDTGKHGYISWVEGNKRQSFIGYTADGQSTFEIRNEKPNGDLNISVTGNGKFTVKGTPVVLEGQDGFHGTTSNIRINSEEEFLAIARKNSNPSKIFRNDQTTTIGGVGRYAPSFLFKAGDTWANISVDYNTGRITSRGGNASGGSTTPARSYLFDDEIDNGFVKKSSGSGGVQRVNSEGSYLNRFDVLSDNSKPDGRLIRTFALPDGRVGIGTRAKNGTWMGDITFPERGNGVFSVDGVVLANLDKYSSQELKQLTNAKMGSGGISDEYFIIGPASATASNRVTSTAFIGTLRGSRGSSNAGNSIWEYSLIYQNTYTGVVYDLTCNFAGGVEIFTGLYFATYQGKRVLVAKLASSGGEQHNGCVFSGVAILKDPDVKWRDMDNGQNLSVTTGDKLTNIEFKKEVSKNITSTGYTVFQKNVSSYNTGAGVTLAPSSGKDATYLQFNTFDGVRRGYIGFGSNATSPLSNTFTIRSDDAGDSGKSITLDDSGVTTETLNLRGTESMRLRLSCSEDNSNYIAFFNNSSLGNQNRTAYVGFGDKNLVNFTLRNDKTSTQLIIGDKMATLNGTRMLVWGDYGLGGTGLRDSTNNFNSFICTSDTNQAQQLGYPGIGAGIQTTYGSDRRGQIFVDTGSRLHFRFSLKSGADTETGWKQAVAQGDFGIGSMQGPVPSKNDFNNAVNSGFYAGPGGVTNPLNAPPQTAQGNPLYGAFIVASRSVTEAFQLGAHKEEVWFRPKTAGVWRDYQRFYTSANTTVDTNGFIKKASPIVKLHDSKVVLNEESEGVTFTKVSTGHYIVHGVLGFNSDGAWGINGGIVIPKDENDQPILWVKTKILKDGDIEVKTYHRQHKDSPEMFQNFRIKEVKKGSPVYYEDGEVVDIPDSAWIDLRVEMPENSTFKIEAKRLDEEYKRKDKEEARISALSSIKESQDNILDNDKLFLENSLKD